MSRPFTEQKVLRKLEIQDFHHLTKDKFITMAPMLDKMDPEVRKKAIEQFPNFSDTTKEILHDYKDSLDKMMEANANSVSSFYESCDMTISSLQEELKRDEQTFEERMHIIEKMMELNKIKGDKDSENKKFIATMALCGLAAIGIGVAGAVAISTGRKH